MLVSKNKPGDRRDVHLPLIQRHVQRPHCQQVWMLWPSRLGGAFRIVYARYVLMTHPVLKIDARKYEELADNIWHAQMNGHPLVLTYAGPFLGRQNRKDAMHFEMDGAKQEIMHLLSRDEYPFACTLEGGKSAWVGHIPGKQNSAQGGLIGSFLRQEAIVPYDRSASKEVQRKVAV